MIKTLSLSTCFTTLLLAASGVVAAPADAANTHFRAIGAGDLATWLW